MTPPSPTNWTIGETIRQMRTDQDMSLGRLAEAAKVSKSNLSKIENNAISPTFDMIDKIAKGLGVSTAALLSRDVPGQDVLSFTNRNEGVRSVSDNYEFEFLFSDLTNRKMMPMITTVRSKMTEVLTAPSSHEGEEFFTVLEGSVEFQSGTEIRRTMNVGDSVYFNSKTKHLVVNAGDVDARLLWVWLA